MKDILEGLNDAQRQAVVCTDGPMMVIAGAGSGKTRVLTYRIARLIELGIDPFNILALTFTNKASREMNARIENLIGSEAKNVWMGTFHAIFSKLLRADGHLLGYPSNYTVYPTDDSKNAIKTIVNELELDPKIYTTNIVAARISAAKSNLISAAEYNDSPELIEYDASGNRPEMGRIYTAYQKKLFRSLAMDFDDIIFNFHILISNFPEILEKYRRRFLYILIDEFQDTNKAQYSIVKQLTYPRNNICVVGDDAQSIYAFRGANIGNILGFQEDFPNLKIFKLEQNYRSTKHIVEASNSIISKNKDQIKKDLWTDNDDGELLRLFQASTDGEEASKVASAIFEKKMNTHAKNADFAILYRTNAQSRAMEEALRRLNIPYVIYSGTSFYQRKEIKDLLAYFRLTINRSDEEALMRIINYPTRGIGQTSLKKIQNTAVEQNISTWDMLIKPQELRNIGISSSTIAKIDAFTAMIINFGNKAKNSDAHTIAKEIAAVSGLIKLAKEDTSPESVARLENIEELINAIGDFTERRNQMIAIENMGELNQDEVVTLEMFMQDVALLTDQDTSKDKEEDRVQMMTIHAAKGLEFPHVFLVGLEENIFPSAQSLFSRADLEEERRLLYVACTRAEKSLTISYAENRYKWGMLQQSEPSRFLKDFDYEHFSQPERSGDRFRRLSTPSIHGFDAFDTEKPYSRKPATQTPQRTEPASASTHPHSPVPTNATPTDIALIKVNDHVYHAKFGRGVILRIEGTGPNKKALVKFEEIGEKLLLLQFAKLIINNN